MTESQNKKNTRRRALLVGVCLPGNENFQLDMEELCRLCEALDVEPAAVVTQNLEREDSASYIGSGKLQECLEEIRNYDADLVVFDNLLSPSQLANLAHELRVEVLDRYGLILQIFQKRARTREARLQVSFAQLQYMFPRLVGLRQNLSRQGGSGGSLSNRGAGETKIELDRRHIQNQMALLRRELKEVRKNRETQRRQRTGAGIPLVALLGYTNAGKSTLMNRLLDQVSRSRELHVEAKDMLFATLDTTVRRIEGAEIRSFLLADTVGFIRNLPHDLVEAFHATLEEAAYADLILDVVDCSDPNYLLEMEVTEKTIEALGAGHVPILHVMNKADRLYPVAELPMLRGDQIYLSAKLGIGMRELLQEIEKRLCASFFTVELLVPYDRADIEHLLRERAKIRELRYEEDGIHIEVSLNQEILGRCKEYLLRLL